MSENPHEQSNTSHIITPTPIFYMLLAGAVSGGFGFGSFYNTDKGKEAILQCADTSNAALTIAAQHSRSIADLQDRFKEWTTDRHTSVDQQKYERTQAARDSLQDREQESRNDDQDRRIRHLERTVGIDG